ncbi:MAG: DUF6089 family protein [Bacteroidota bacterium]
MNRFLLVCVTAVLPFLSFSQDSEIGLIFGATGYSGDITPTSKMLSTGNHHASLSIFGRLDFNRFVAGRASLMFGKISSSDADARSEALRARNLSFQSNLTELAGIIEINPLGTNSMGYRFQPYVYGGVAFFHFKPEANYSGQLVELQPLGTEGQGMDGFGEKYRLNQISIPMGIGVKYRITERINLGFDIGLRKTFTDYLDDVSGTYVNYNELLAGNGSVAAALGNRQGELIEPGTEPVLVETGAQRGNPDNKDWYYNAGVTLSYTFFGSTKRKIKGRNPTGREFGCPATRF